MNPLENVQRIEPTRLEVPPEAISDLVAEIAAASAGLGRVLHPCTAAHLAFLVAIMNSYYSNLIEGHNTRPKDIERAVQGDLESDRARRNLQLEAVAHVRVQREIDRRFFESKLPDAVSKEFILWLHCEFYKDAPEEFLRTKGTKTEFLMTPGEWRSRDEQEVEVGRHVPPSSRRVDDFMTYFENTYRFDRLGGKTGQMIALATSHHRFNYIHPFPDGNGRVSRLMSHALAQKIGIGAQGLWSISRGLARGLAAGVDGRSEYKRMMDHADMPRQGDLDGRGNLSQRALADFVDWFLRICLDQITFMASLFELNTLSRRLCLYVERNEKLKPEAARLLENALIRGEFERGEASRITGLPERSARRVLNDVEAAGLLASETPKGSVSLRFPTETLEILFPRLFPDSATRPD
jgi:Fic family protein